MQDITYALICCGIFSLRFTYIAYNISVTETEKLEITLLRFFQCWLALFTLAQVPAHTSPRLRPSPVPQRAKCYTRASKGTHEVTNCRRRRIERASQSQRIGRIRGGHLSLAQLRSNADVTARHLQCTVSQ